MFKIRKQSVCEEANFHTRSAHFVHSGLSFISNDIVLQSILRWFAVGKEVKIADKVFLIFLIIANLNVSIVVFFSRVFDLSLLSIIITSGFAIRTDLQINIFCGECKCLKPGIFLM